MLVLYKKWKKYNEFQLTRNKMDLNNRKWKIIHPPTSEESHPVTDPLGKTVVETGDKLITTLSKYKNNKQNMVIFYKKFKKYNEIQLTKNKIDLNIRKMINHPPFPIILKIVWIYLLIISLDNYNNNHRLLIDTHHTQYSHFRLTLKLQSSIYLTFIRNIVYYLEILYNFRNCTFNFLMLPI